MSATAQSHLQEWGPAAAAAATVRHSGATRTAVPATTVADCSAAAEPTGAPTSPGRAPQPFGCAGAAGAAGAQAAISLLVVAFWRGTWVLCDVYLYPQNPARSAWVRAPPRARRRPLRHCTLAHWATARATARSGPIASVHVGRRIVLSKSLQFAPQRTVGLVRAARAMANEKALESTSADASAPTGLRMRRRGGSQCVGREARPRPRSRGKSMRVSVHVLPA